MSTPNILALFDKLQRSNTRDGDKAGFTVKVKGHKIGCTLERFDGDAEDNDALIETAETMGVKSKGSREKDGTERNRQVSHLPGEHSGNVMRGTLLLGLIASGEADADDLEPLCEPSAETGTDAPKGKPKGKRKGKGKGDTPAETPAAETPAV